MTVKQEISLNLTCECPYCRLEGAPLVARFFGQSIEECYKTAVKEGWLFLQGKDFLHCYNRRCLLEEELWL